MRPERINGRGSYEGGNATRPMEPSVNESAKQYPVEIYQVENGFVVNVGCKTLVFKTISELQEALGLFYMNFEKAKEKYLK